VEKVEVLALLEKMEGWIVVDDEVWRDNERELSDFWVERELERVEDARRRRRGRFSSDLNRAIESLARRRDLDWGLCLSDLLSSLTIRLSNITHNSQREGRTLKA